MKNNSLLAYLKSRDFFKQLKAALAIFFAIVFASSIGLYFCTRHNSSKPVPDFKGLNPTQAQELADDYNVRLSVMDSVFTQDFSPGTVVDQYPHAGIRVKKNRRIFLIMNAMNPEKIEMPNIVGVSLRQALAILESNGLLPGNLKYVPDIATNNVLRQKFNGEEIKPGSAVFKGSHIDIVLGKSSNSEKSEIPDLTGLTFRQSEKKISEAYLNLGAVIFDSSVKTITDSINATVYKQKPDIETNGRATMGSLVDIWLKVTKVTTDEDIAE